MVDETRCPLKELYEEFGNETIASIRAINLESKDYQMIREKYQDDPGIVEQCRMILFENNEQIKFLRRQGEYEHRKVKEYDKQSG